MVVPHLSMNDWINRTLTVLISQNCEVLVPKSEVRKSRQEKKRQPQRGRLTFSVGREQRSLNNSLNRPEDIFQSWNRPICFSLLHLQIRT